jgi:hypothetical protein
VTAVLGSVCIWAGHEHPAAGLHMVQPNVPTSTMVEDEFHEIPCLKENTFKCKLCFTVYHHIRLKYEIALFAEFGGVSRVCRLMKTPGKVSAVLEQEPRHVASCLCLGVFGVDVSRGTRPTTGTLFYQGGS